MKSFIQVGCEFVNEEHVIIKINDTSFFVSKNCDKSNKTTNTQKTTWKYRNFRKFNIVIFTREGEVILN